MPFTKEQIDLISRTVCKDCTPDELQTFLHVCDATGLDPLLRQVHPVRRFDRDANREVMSIQTGIDGYRLIADRTGKYAPGREPTFAYDDAGKLKAATAYVKKRTDDGTWHEVSATAFWDEYVGLKRDGKPTRFWATKPHIMLPKCAEALALRRAFPAELAGLYTHEEMEQANNPDDTPAPKRATRKLDGPTADDVWGELMRMTGGDGEKTEALCNVILGVSTVDEIADPADAMKRVAAYTPPASPKPTEPEPPATAGQPRPATRKELAEMLLQMSGGDKAAASARCVELLGVKSPREVPEQSLGDATIQVGAAMAEFLKRPV